MIPHSPTVNFFSFVSSGFTVSCSGELTRSWKIFRKSERSRRVLLIFLFRSSYCVSRRRAHRFLAQGVNDGRSCHLDAVIYEGFSDHVSGANLYAVSMAGSDNNPPCFRLDPVNLHTQVDTITKTRFFHARVYTKRQDAETDVRISQRAGRYLLCQRHTSRTPRAPGRMRK